MLVEIGQRAEDGEKMGQHTHGGRDKIVPVVAGLEQDDPGLVVDHPQQAGLVLHLAMAEQVFAAVHVGKGEFLKGVVEGAVDVGEMDLMRPGEQLVNIIFGSVMITDLVGDGFVVAQGSGAVDEGTEFVHIMLLDNRFELAQLGRKQDNHPREHHVLAQVFHDCEGVLGVEVGVVDLEHQEALLLAGCEQPAKLFDQALQFLFELGAVAQVGKVAQVVIIDVLVFLVFQGVKGLEALLEGL